MGAEHPQQETQQQRDDPRAAPGRDGSVQRRYGRRSRERRPGSGLHRPYGRHCGGDPVSTVRERKIMV
ncbi:hypothetical protein JCM9533A_05130 [Catenuloplanes niger JCM 9533]